MEALRLAWSFVRIPRLFLHLFFWPLLLSLVVVYGQLFITSMYVHAVNRESSGSSEAASVESWEQKTLRRLLYGNEETLPPLKICRWADIQTNGLTVERPTNKECLPDHFDVAIQTNDPAHFDPGDYLKKFNLEGNVSRLHLCRNCQPDLVFDLKGAAPASHTYSVWGLLSLTLIRSNTTVTEHYVEAAKVRSDIKDTLGDIYLHAKGFRAPILLSEVPTSMAVLVNICFLTITTLWLALRAHRKILDYFSKSGALLPLVAATGKNNFYASIWILTLFRVGAFLAAAVPMVLVVLVGLMTKEDLDAFFGPDFIAFVIWIIAIVASFALATVVSSIAELKSRHTFVGFLYRYLPLVLSGTGAILWVATFLFDGQVSGAIREAVCALPIIGMAPIILSPIFEPRFEILVFSTLLTVSFLILALKYNARWFAAHLEEL